MIPQFNDDHNIDENFQKLKFLIKETEEDLYKYTFSILTINALPENDSYF